MQCHRIFDKGNGVMHHQPISNSQFPELLFCGAVERERSCQATDSTGSGGTDLHCSQIGHSNYPIYSDNCKMQAEGLVYLSYESSAVYPGIILIYIMQGSEDHLVAFYCRFCPKD